MSPKKCRGNLTTSGGEEERRHRRHRRIRREKEKRRIRREKEKKKKKKNRRVKELSPMCSLDYGDYYGNLRRMELEKEEAKKLLCPGNRRTILTIELEAEEANKSLYACSIESHPGNWVAYVVRAIRLSDLLSSSSSLDHPLQLPQVAYKGGSDLPGSVGCGVWGSQIVFAGGLKPSVPWGLGACNSNSVWHMDVYGFEPHRQDEEDNALIRKMDARFSLRQAKFYPFIVEIQGKLYAMSYRVVAKPPMFEVFDPQVGSWAALPDPEFLKENSPHHRSAEFSYAVAGTKMFVSNAKCPIFCFDVAHPRREWRLVPTMCGGGPFPFVAKALVLDLPDDKNKKIMFGYSHQRYWKIGVYLMSLVKKMESIKLIGNVELPALPPELGRAKGCQFVHIGGWKACAVVTHLGLHDSAPYEPAIHTTWGVAIPFQFQVDMSKADDEGMEDCFTIQFMPPCVLKYHTNPSTYPEPETVGCFVL